MGAGLRGWWIVGPCKEIVMAYKINDECTKCGSCVEACPSEAISEGQDKFVINPDVCIDCGACTDSCPNEAIVEG